MKDLDEGRAWCEEAWVLLGERKAPKPVPQVGEDAPPVVAPVLPEDAANERSAAALKLKQAFQNRFSKNPPGATAAQIARLDALRTRFTNGYAGNLDETRLTQIEATFDDMVTELAATIDDIASAAELRLQLDTLAPPGASGTALVPGATTDDTAGLEALRDTATQALAAANTRRELNTVQATLKDIATARTEVETRVEARVKRAEQLRADAAAILKPPESPPGTLDSERTAVTAPLTSPLTELSLTAAEGALKTLRSAWDAAEKEAAALRQMRALFRVEAGVLRARLNTLDGDLPKTKKWTGAVAPLLLQLDKAQALLDVPRLRAETEGFPAALVALKNEVMVLVGKAVSEPNEAGKAAAAFLKVELKRLNEEAGQLPNPDATSAEYAGDAETQYWAASKKLGAGSVNQATQARPLVLQLADTIDAWRKYVGPVGIVLGQRKSQLETQMAAPDPANASAAFKAKLKGVRDKVKLSTDKPLHEDSISKAEADATPFAALLAAADVDARAFVQVTSARVTLAGELGDIIAAARPATRIELTKAKTLADTRALLTDTDRDMPRTLALHQDLLVRMREVKNEPTFAAADKAPLAVMAESVREQAFNLCGPTLIGTLPDGARQALGAVLLTDGPAIQKLNDEALGGNPKVLAQLLNQCGAAGLATLARALDGDDKAASRAALDGLIEKGGLGKNPAILSRLLGDAPLPGDNPVVTKAKLDRQTANTATLKSLADNFSGDSGQQAMTSLLGDCGLGANADILPALMQEHGLAGDGAKLRQFADAYTGPGDERAADRAGLARIVNTGGIAAHPKAFAPLVKRGGAASVKKIANAFVAPGDCANLAGLLNAGGMSGDAGLPGQEHKHEHPDTLSKVFEDGLGGKGENLKTYAAAFSGPLGQAKSKEMLNAFNEYPDANAQQRQPGEAIGKLLDGTHLQGTTAQRIQKLSTQFVPQIQTIANADQRKQAMRMAPHFDTASAQEGWKPVSPAMTTANIKKVTSSVLKRHQPEAFDRSKMKVGVPQSMFPPGTDVGNLLDQALAQIGPDRSRAYTVPVNVAPPPTVIMVEIGFLAGDTVNHFGPRGNAGPPHPKETPIFSNAEINAIYAAIN